MDSAKTRCDLTVYIPTYGRFQQCVSQVAAVTRLCEDTGIKVRVIVSINGDPTYDSEALRVAGASSVISRGQDLGGNANICLGYEWLASCDYLWILSDDDPVQDSGFSHIAAAMNRGTDLILGCRSDCRMETSVRGSEDDLLRSGAAIDLISASICRSSCLKDLAPLAFDRIATSYPHAGVIIEAIRRGTVKTVSLLPLQDLVDDSPSVLAVGATRASAGATQGVQFFGGALLASLKHSNSFDRRNFNAWWAQHWHRASMYRRSRSAQQAWADRMARSSPISLGWWLLSLPPYWRLKDLVRPRGEPVIDPPGP